MSTSKKQAHYIAKGVPIEKIQRDKGIFVGIVSIVCAILSLFLYPIIFGGFGILFGIMAINKDSRALGVIGIVLSVVLMLLGLIVGLLLFAFE